MVGGRLENQTGRAMFECQIWIKNNFTNKVLFHLKSSIKQFIKADIAIILNVFDLMVTCT